MFINLKNIKKSLKEYSKEGPFDHCVIDDFFELEHLPTDEDIIH